MNDKLQVWSCGGGTQSCAIAALIVQGKLPKPDFAVIADTGYETRATWEYMDAVLTPKLAEVEVDLQRIKTADWNPKRASLFYKYKKDPNRLSDLEIPAFSTRETEAGDGKMKNWCTGRWKVETIDRWLSKVHHVTRSKMVKWIGFSCDEATRYLRMMRGEEYKKGLIMFPLVEKFRLRRHECVKVVADMGWPRPPRSACWMCPNHSPQEWLDLKVNRPDEFQKAVELEREIHKVDPDAWLHRSCVPLDQVDFSQPEDLFSRPCDSGQCFV